jgi:hypothetical protein
MKLIPPLKGGWGDVRVFDCIVLSWLDILHPPAPLEGGIDMVYLLFLDGIGKLGK